MAHIGREKRETEDFTEYTSMYEGHGAVPPTREELEVASTMPEYTNVKPKKSGKKKVAMIGKIIAIFVIVAAVVCGILVYTGASSVLARLAQGLPIPTLKTTTVEISGSDMTDDEKLLLTNAGYDPVEITKTLQGFSSAFLTYSPASLESGQWHEEVAKYVNASAVTSAGENALDSRWKSSTWAKEMAQHPSALSTLESIDDVEWYMIENADGESIPFCYMTCTLTRPVLDYYSLNSPPCEVSRFQDCYNIYFTKEGDVYRIRRASSSLVENNLEGDLTARDKDRMADERSYKHDAIDYEAEARKKAEEEAKKKEEEERLKKEDEEAKKKLEEEIEAERKAAEDAAKKAEEERRAAEDAAARAAEEAANQNSGGNSGGSSGGNSGGNQNSGSEGGSGDGGSGGNQNSGGDGGDSGGSANTNAG